MKTLNLKTLLVPIDFSNNSMNAIELSTSLAKQHNLKMHLLYVNDIDYELYANDVNLKPPTKVEYAKRIEQLAETIVSSDGVECTFSYETGAVTHTILKYAIDHAIDLIIMGKNGNSGRSKPYAGSHTYQVVVKSRIPVLIVPGGVLNYSFNNILFPIRPLLSVTDKYDAIKELILKNKSKLTILNMRNPAYQNELDIIHQLSLLMKEKLEKDQVDYKLEYYFEDNNFADYVLKVIEKDTNRFDLAVITAEVDRNIKSFHLSSYAQQIVHQSTIPILVLRPSEAKQDKDQILSKLSSDNK